jgi:hypothetical protein
MAQLEAFAKTTYERHMIFGEFEDVLCDGENLVLASSEISATDKDGADKSSEVLNQSTKSIVASPKRRLGIRCRAGDEASSPYKIVFKTVTDQGNRWQLDILMVVKHLPH